MVTITLLHPRQKTPVKQWHLKAKARIRIGRSPDNDVCLSDILVSRYHLELHYREGTLGQGGWYLQSRGINGTFLNGKLVSQGRLTDNSVLQLGPSGPILKFEFSAELDADTTPDVCTHAGNFPGNLFCIHCGEPLQVLRTIHTYQVLRLLGHGGMGTTFLVCTTPTQVGEQPQLRVLKEINAAMEEVPKAQELFEREARILKSLNHKGIPRFYDYFMEEQKQYLVMELIHGQDLDKWVLQRGVLAAEQAIVWMLQACEVLDYLHQQHPPVIHRDLKPSNLLLRSRDQQIVVIDFGAVKEAGEAPGTRISVEGYSAPEQSLGHPLIQSDLYAIGATLIFLLTGQNPIKFYRNRGQGYRFHLEELPGLPESLKQVIATATAPRPADRYQSAMELAAALKNCLSDP
uniref:Serine/threonine protein kinase with FHA domain protein n=1 Tax=Cyanothece sp. (strain PCC 7425 / ATCC 29141) TaxID=395961 RepID=B8HMI9_CYAP4